MQVSEMIENKRKEFEAASAKDAGLWKEYHEQEERLNAQFRNPWSEAYNAKLRLEKELAALETIAKEMEAK